ncbi:hypothetical protein LCGC14_1991430 [marine sediment metagenome]|uniref:Uncharacterized protein n=1 Tax=marine sediment metagenome TaxID=412755 RepID=A0A0F9FU26_9ZZZZ
MSGEGVHNPAAIDTLALEASLQAVQVDVDAIREVTDAEAILTETSGSITTTAAEQNVYAAVAPAGIFRPVCFKIDMSNQTATETVVLRTYYQITPGGALVLQDTVTYAGVVSPELINIDLEPNRYGVAVTLQNTAIGTHRAYDWEIFYAEAP